MADRHAQSGAAAAAQPPAAQAGQQMLFQPAQSTSSPTTGQPHPAGMFYLQRVHHPALVVHPQHQYHQDLTFNDQLMDTQQQQQQSQQHQQLPMMVQMPVVSSNAQMFTTALYPDHSNDGQGFAEVSVHVFCVALHSIVVKFRPSWWAVHAQLRPQVHVEASVEVWTFYFPQKCISLHGFLANIHLVCLTAKITLD